MNRTKLSYIYASLAILFWSTIPTTFKLTLSETDIMSMLAIASYTSFLVLLFILLAGKKAELIKKNSPRELIYSAILGCINPFFYYIMLLKAYQLLPAQIAQPLNMIWPMIIVVLSYPVLKQKIKKKSYLALLISFTGVYIISSQGKPLDPGHSNLPGILLATGSAFLWAVYFLLNVKDKRDEAVKLLLNFFFGSVYLTVALVVTGMWPLEISFRGLIGSVYTGLFEMGITFFFWLKALQLATTTDKVSSLVYLAPFLSLFFVHFILREPVYYTTPAGLVLIIAGIMISNSKAGGK